MGERTGQRVGPSRGDRRWAAKAVASAAIVVAVVLSGGGTAATQESDFLNGEAKADARTFALNLVQAAADVGFIYGRSQASYADQTATGSADALDLGALPTILAKCKDESAIPPMNPDTLPKKATVDSTASNAAASRREEVFLPGFDGGPRGESAGFQDAFAWPTPASRAVTESADADMYLLALDGGRTEVSTKLEGRVREARAVSEADELRVFGGLFTFEHPRWEAVTRSGAVEESTGSFTFERATVLGMERDKEAALRDFKEFERGLEWLLKPLGVQLDLPQVEPIDGGVKVTPMAFRIVDPPFGKQVLGPFFSSSYFRAWSEASTQSTVCSDNVAAELLNVVGSTLSGAGAVEILAGGVDVFTAATDFSIPLPEPLGSFEVPDLPMAPVEAPPPPTEPFGTTTTTTSTTTTTTTTTAPPKVGGKQEYAAAAATSRFEDTSAGSTGVVVGIVGLVGALALMTGERLLARRNSRRIP